MARFNPAWLFIGLKLTKIVAVLKTVQVFKVLFSLASILVSVVAYGLTLGLWFSIGFVTMLFIHEMGHVIALRRRNLPCSLPVFIPFLGAAIFAPDMGDRDTEAYVGYGGPLLGSIAAIACFGLWAALGGTSDLLLLISYVGVYLNLFNLIPISPLDGGRITQAVGGWLKYVGAAMAFALVAFSRQPGMIFLLILILDNFSFPLLVRPIVATGLLAVMIGLIVAGYSEAGLFWIDVIDVGVGFLITVMFVLREWSDTSAELAIARRYQTHQMLPIGPVPEHFISRMRFAQRHAKLFRKPKLSRPMPALHIRLGWLAAYIVLAVVLGGTIAVQNTYLPSHLQPQPETHSLG